MTENDATEPLGEVLLASGSPWRRELLLRAGLPCRCEAPEVEEAEIEGEDPVQTARLRALAKARWVAGRNPGRLVIGADQVLWDEAEPRPKAIGKPASAEAQLARLRSFVGRRHALCTAVALLAPEEWGGEEVFEVRSRVRFRADLTDQELLAYVQWGEARACAGGYMVEGRGAALIEEVEGDLFNVIGLPIFALVGRLRARGLRLLPDGGWGLRTAGPQVGAGR